MTFHDRIDAGRRLAAQLMKYKDENPVVLGLPRGGVVVAAEIARELNAQLDVIIVRKLGAPHNPEFGIGAIAPGGIRVLDAHSIQMLGLTQLDIEQITAHEQIELDRRLQLYHGDRPPLHLQGRTVILVDDGLATGVTARAAIEAVTLQGPRKRVLAAPVGARETVDLLRKEVDELLCLVVSDKFRAVGQFYRAFEQTSDEEVVALLQHASKYRGRVAGAPAS